MTVPPLAPVRPDTPCLGFRRNAVVPKDLSGVENFRIPRPPQSLGGKGLSRCNAFRKVPIPPPVLPFFGSLGAQKKIQRGEDLTRASISTERGVSRARSVRWECQIPKLLTPRLVVYQGPRDALEERPLRRSNQTLARCYDVYRNKKGEATIDPRVPPKTALSSQLSRQDSSHLHKLSRGSFYVRSGFRFLRFIREMVESGNLMGAQDLLNQVTCDEIFKARLRLPDYMQRKQNSMGEAFLKYAKNIIERNSYRS